MSSEDVTALPHIDIGSNGHCADYIEPAEAFISEDDAPVQYIIPELLPVGVIMLIHGEPRARKTLAGFEFALAAATGTPAFGLNRFAPPRPVTTLYIQEEDPRNLTRPRLRALIRERCGRAPDTLHVSVRRGVNLDDRRWVTRIITDCQRLGVSLLVLDAARRLSALTDEGPAKVRELTGVLRRIVIEADVSIVIVHHDVKPPSNGNDQRRRSQRASGGDWFAACECPVHVEKVGDESLAFPEDFKFTTDPAPFKFRCETEGGLITRLVGSDTTTEQAEAAGAREKLLAWLRSQGPAPKTAMKQAGFGWETIQKHLAALMEAGKVDSRPGRKAGTNVYFVVEEASS